MIAKKFYYQKAVEVRDKVIVEICVDRELIEIMQKKILHEIEDTSVYSQNDAYEINEIREALNYIQSLITSYKSLCEALDDIAAKEDISKIPGDEDES